MINPTRHQSPVGLGEQTKNRVARPTGRVSKRQWLDAALKVLVSEGIAAVRIVNLARRLKISKSGFYWHFENREELLSEMRRYWVDEFSQRIIAEVLGTEIQLKEKLLMVVQILRAKEASKYDLAFTSWAQTDPIVRELLNSVRNMRIEFVKGLLSENGYTGVALESRARLFVVYFSWSDVMFRDTESEFVGESLDEVLSIICS